MNNLREEFNKEFVDEDNPEFINDYIPSKKLWQWIETRITKAKIEENNYWIGYVERFGSANMSRYFKNANKHNFLDRISELEKELK